MERSLQELFKNWYKSVVEKLTIILKWWFIQKFILSENQTDFLRGIETQKWRNGLWMEWNQWKTYRPGKTRKCINWWRGLLLAVPTSKNKSWKNTPIAIIPSCQCASSPQKYKNCFIGSQAIEWLCNGVPDLKRERKKGNVVGWTTLLKHIKH